ncbi:MAG: hypothetical protein H6883_07010 [Rhodobiaceae bacterium]|nr:hypothetical protein [Rhodobiaceae bacterium]MCC0055869.1 hypothetical protein [Rhodobiaceae bacterium]
MPRRAAKRPITAERVEQALDTLAEIMAAAGASANLMVPVWKRLEAEHSRLRDEEDVVAAALARVRQLTDRREARSA